jgi:hypothetical protein
LAQSYVTLTVYLGIGEAFSFRAKKCRRKHRMGDAGSQKGFMATSFSASPHGYRRAGVADVSVRPIILFDAK